MRGSSLDGEMDLNELTAITNVGFAKRSFWKEEATMEQTDRRTGLWVLLAVLVFGVLGANTPAWGQGFVSGSTGADGPFNPTCAPVPCTVTVTPPANGVFNFTTVNVPAGVTVKFARNASNTPVFILATGDVSINGIIDVSGANVAVGSATGGSGGPGGFDGGNGGSVQAARGADGLGPGGGGGGGGVANAACSGGGGGFGAGGANGGCANIIVTPPGSGGPSYGTEFLNPLVGGSGGGGGGSTNSGLGGAGGGGGGAILVASSGSITLGAVGDVLATGGAGAGGIGIAGCGGGGSGGAVRLIANTFLGRGSGVRVSSGFGGTGCFGGGAAGGVGRIRIEFANQSLTSPFLSTASLGRPGPVFVPGTPTLRIASVGGVAAPATPGGSFASPDISLPPSTTSPVTIGLAASNVPLGTTVNVTVFARFGAKTTVTSTPLAGTVADSMATAEVTLPVGTGTSVVLMAQATFTVQQASLLPTIDGEKIAKVQVAATLGGGSTLTYITQTGKEIPASQLPPLLYTQLAGSGIQEARK